MNNNIIYFELNNWARGKYYPNAEPFISWLYDDFNQYFSNEKWVKDNKLCVVIDYIDMSINYSITATKEWVEKNCPELLSKYTEFLRYEDENGDVFPNLGSFFLEYEDYNFGITYSDED